MRFEVQTLVQLGLVTSLGSLYLLSLGEWISRPGLYPSNSLELVVLGLIVLRLLLFLGIPVARRMKIQMVVILFGSDVYAVLLIFGLYVVTGDTGLAGFGRLFASAWIGSAPLVFPPLALFLIFRSVRSRVRPYFVIPAVATSFGLLSLVTSAIAVGDGTGGLGGLAYQELDVLRGTAGPLGGSPLLSYASAIIFAALAAYGLLGSGHLSGGPWVPSMTVGVVGVLLLLGWAEVPVLSRAGWITMGIPAVLMVGAVWLMTRE
ncbi:MAG: hypothetical protein OK404_02495 [Thaumarchaeota archaeon]|nr:hypothetical protein [Nitrososphaerota archaeon]